LLDAPTVYLNVPKVLTFPPAPMPLPFEADRSVKSEPSVRLVLKLIRLNTALIGVPALWGEVVSVNVTRPVDVSPTMSNVAYGVVS